MDKQLDIERVYAEYRKFLKKHYKKGREMTEAEKLCCRSNAYVVARMIKKSTDINDPALYRYAAADANLMARTMSNRGYRKARRLATRYMREARPLFIERRLCGISHEQKKQSV